MSYVINGTAYWAKVYPSNANEGKYSIDIGLKNQSDIDFLTKLGLKVKDPVDANDKRGKHITLKAYVKDYNGNETVLPVVDSKLNTVPESTLIGNGSEVNVEFYVKNYPNKSKVKGVYGYLCKVQVVELVEYKGSSGLKALDGGFIADTNQAPQSAQEDLPPFELNGDDEIA